MLLGGAMHRHERRVEDGIGQLYRSVLEPLPGVSIEIRVGRHADRSEGLVVAARRSASMAERRAWVA